MKILPKSAPDFLPIKNWKKLAEFEPIFGLFSQFWPNSGHFWLSNSKSYKYLGQFWKLFNLPILPIFWAKADFCSKGVGNTGWKIRRWRRDITGPQTSENMEVKYFLQWFGILEELQRAAFENTPVKKAANKPEKMVRPWTIFKAQVDSQPTGGLRKRGQRGWPGLFCQL